MENVFYSGYAPGGAISRVVALCCSVLQCAVVSCSVLQCVAVCCSVLQCVAVAHDLSVLPNVVVHMYEYIYVRMLYTRVSVHTCMYIYICNVHVYICMHVCIYTYTGACC